LNSLMDRKIFFSQMVLELENSQTEELENSSQMELMKLLIDNENLIILNIININKYFDEQINLIFVYYI
jgi:hypothetical protein